MYGLKQIAQFQTTSDDGRAHVVHVYQDEATTGEAPFLITGEGWQVAPVRDGVFRVYGTGLVLKRMEVIVN